MKKNVKKTTKADTDTSSESDCEYLQQTARHDCLTLSKETEIR